MLIGQFVGAAFFGFMVAFAIVFAFIVMDRPHWDGCCCCGADSDETVPSRLSNVCRDCEAFVILAKQFNWNWDLTQDWILKITNDYWDREIQKQQKGL